MLIELLCPKCKAPLEVDDDLKLGICPYCGTKSLISDTIPQKVELDMPDMDRRRAEQLTEYAIRMFIQGERGSSFKALDDALKLDPDNTKAWILYSVISGKPLASNIRSKLDKTKGKEFATELLRTDPSLSKSICAIYPDLSSVLEDKGPRWDVKWDNINSGSFMIFDFEYNCKPKKDSVVHYYNWVPDDLSLVRGKNSLELESGIHVFVNRITGKYLAISVPESVEGTPLGFSSWGRGFYTEPGMYKFTGWRSDSDTLLVNSFETDAIDHIKYSVDCSGMKEKVESLLNSV